MNANVLRHRRGALLALAIATLLTPAVSRAQAQSSIPPVPTSDRWNYAAIKNAPEKERSRPNPLANDRDAVAAGGKLFGDHCAECHGLKAEGGKRAPSLLRDEVQKATPGALFWVLSNGVVWHGMPDWSKLPEPQRWQIIAFLRDSGSSSRPREEPGPR